MDKNNAKAISKENLQALAKLRAPDARLLGVEKRWLDRITKDGVSYVSTAKRSDFEKLANHYGISVEDFFKAGFSCERLQTVERFKALIATGKHSYLVNLINDLYERSWVEVFDYEAWVSQFPQEAILSFIKEHELSEEPEVLEGFRLFFEDQFESEEDVEELADDLRRRSGESSDESSGPDTSRKT
jgi:hypothetical protein